MKQFWKWSMSVVLTWCMLAVPLTAFATPAPINLMPQEEAGYTIVEGDGTVTLDGESMTIVNNTDGDLRIWINYATPFDMTEYNTVSMEMTAGMPFKMAFHLISDADTSNDWLTTSTDYLDQFELDTATDRSPAGDYNVAMNIGDLAVDITDTSSVHFDQFILLMTGKGTFTVNRVELTGFSDTEQEPSEYDTEEPIDTDTKDDTLTDGAVEEETDDADETGFPWIPVGVGGVVLIAAAVVILLVIKRKG